MARGERSVWVLLLLRLLVLGCCAIFTRAHAPSQLTNRACRQHPSRRNSLCAWVKIGSFELLTVEELKEEMLGPWASNGEGSSLEREKTSAVTAANTSTINAPTSRVKLLAVRLEGVSQKLGKFAEGGGTTLRMWGGQSLEMGKRGAVWLQERWRVKLVYCALAIYGIRVSGRVACRLYAALRSDESSSEVILDADDRALGSRGAILELEGVALLVKLGAVGHLSPADPARSLPSHGKLEEEEEEENDHGWGTVEVEIRRAIGLRCNGGRKEQYAEELAQALRGLEEARDNADIEAVGSQRASLLEQAVLLIQARLCDACLRSLRNGLVLSASDLSMLRAFWYDQKSNHRRMGVLKSIMLGRLHGKVFGKRVTLEKDQEKISSCELLLERHLRRLGGVQLHLQARPRISMEAVAPTSGGAFTDAAITSLKEWVDVGVEMLLCELEELETALLTVSDVTMSPQRQQRLANGVGKEAMITDSIIGGGKGETEALTEHCWRPSNSTDAESGVGSEGTAEDSQALAIDPVTSGPRARACLHLPGAQLFEIPPLAVTMLRAGWDCGANSSCVSPLVECKIPDEASQSTLSGPSAIDKNFMEAKCGGTTLLKIYPGSSAIPAVVLLFRLKPKSKSGDDGGVAERTPPTNSGSFNRSKARLGKEGGRGDGGRCAHQPPGWRKDERAIGEGGESKNKSTLVVDAWKWLTTAKSSGHQHQNNTDASRPGDKAKPRAKGWDDFNKVVGRTPRASSSRRGDTMAAGTRADVGGGWIKLFASGDFGERRTGEKTETPIVETGNRSRTPKRNGAFSAVASPKKLPLVQRRTSNVVIEGEANTKRFQVRKASEQKQASGGRSKRFPSIAVKGRGSFAASKKDKVRAGVKALESDNVKLGRNRPHDLGGRRWEGRVSSLAAAAKRESRRLFPFGVSRRNSGDEGKGMVSGVLDGGLSAKGIIVVAAVGLTAAAVAALIQVTRKAESSPYASTGGATPGTFNGDGDFSGTASSFALACRVRNSSDSLKATKQDVEDVDSSTEHAGKYVAGLEAASRALLRCDSTDPRRSSTAEEESIDYRCESDDPAEPDVGPRFPVEARNTTGVSDGDLAFEETRSSRYEQGGTNRRCSHPRLGNSLSRTISVCHREATVIAGRGRAMGMRGAHISSKFGAGCVRFAGVVLTSPVRPAHVGIRAICGACATVVVGMESSAARLKRRCVRVGRSVVGAAASGSSAATVATCMAGGTVLKGLVKSGRVCARGACSVLSAAGEVARNVFIAVDPREFDSRLRFVRRGPLVRLSRWVARIVASGCLGIGSSARVVGGAAVRGSVKITCLCTGGAILVLSFLPMKAVWTVKDIATLPADNISKTGTAEIEQAMAASGLGGTSTDAKAADGSRLSCSKDADHFNMTLCQQEDLALVGFSATNSAAKENKSTGSDQKLTSVPEDMLLKELDTAANPCFDEKSQTECLQGFLPSHSAVDSLSFGLFAQDPNLDVAPKSEARSSSGNDPLLPTRVSYREEAFVDVPERSAQRSRRLVSGVTRAAKIVATTGGSGRSGVAGAEGIGIRTISVARALRVNAAEEAAVMGCARPSRNRALRMALSSVLVAPATFRFGRYLSHNWTELRRVQVEAAAGLSTFFSEQLWEPCQAIVKQVLFRERQSFLVDQAALEDAETSLRNMLRDFVRVKQNRVPEEIREQVVSAMDMSVVSRKLEKETRGAIRGTVSGKIPQMLLIQGTYLKKELLQAMQGIDDLYQANQVTLRLISIVPAALVIVGTYKISTVLLQAAASRRLEPTTRVHRSMRALVRDIERLLTSSSGFASGQRVGDEGVLDKEETGKLALRLHTLQTTLRKNSSRFDARARRALEEDLSDMTRDSTTVLQQMGIIRRLQRSYPFLRPEGG